MFVAGIVPTKNTFLVVLFVISMCGIVQTFIYWVDQKAHLGFSITLTHAQLLQLYPTLCNPMDPSRADFSVHGILQARILEWVAISSSRDLPHPGIKPISPMSPTLQVDSLPTGKVAF